MTNSIGPSPADKLFIDVFRGAQSRPVRSMRQFAEEELVIPSGPFEGQPFRVSTQPITGLLLDEFDSDRWWEFYITAPSQSSKSLVAFVTPLCYHTAELAETYVVGLPDMTMAQNKWENDIVPIFRASPRLRALLPNSGPGSRGGKITDTVTLANGVMIKFMTAGGDDTSKAGFTSRSIGVTEAARFSIPSGTSVEADPLRQLRARQRAYPRELRRTYAEGTVTIERELPWIARELSSQSKIVTPCPHCGVWIAPEREDFGGWQEARSELEAADLATFYCPACGEAISDQQRRSVMGDSKILHGDQKIDKRGRVRGDLPQTRRLWFRWSAWHNLLLSPADIGAEEWLADQAPEESDERESAEKERCQFVWCNPYEAPELEIENLAAGDVEKRSAENLPRGVLPENTQWLTLFSDAGMYRCHWVAIAWRSDGTIHIPDYGTIEVLHRGQGDKDQRRRAVKIKLREALGTLASRCKTGFPMRGVMLRPNRVAVDARYLPATVHTFVASQGSTYFPAIGLGTGQQEGKVYKHPRTKTKQRRFLGEQYFLEKHKQYRTLMFVNDSDYWKTQVHDAFGVDPGEPGSVTLFRDDEKQHATFERHIISEQREKILHTRHGLITVWTNKTGKANHFLDATYGAFVLGHHCGFRVATKQETDESGSADAETSVATDWFSQRRA